MPRQPNLAVAAYRELIGTEAAFSASQRAWIESLPVEAAIEAVDAVPGGIAYGGPSDVLEETVGRAEAIGGQDWRVMYLRMLVLRLLARGVQHPPASLPVSVAELQEAELTRILTEAESARRRRYRLDNESFRKDVEFCRQRLLQLGNLVGVTDASLPARVREEYADAPHGPWLEVHLRVKDYTQEPPSERPTRHRRAEFLVANPHYAGTFSVSWMNDPALAEISPHQFERRQSALDAGARIFRIGSGEQTIAFAIAASKTRRRAYEEGRYVPTDYAMVWPRDVMIAWAGQNRS